jgi:ABC-type glycerol-3-phosphate transport system substrate-binding protein
MKRILSSLLAALCMITLAGCSSGGSDAKTSSNGDTSSGSATKDLYVVVAASYLSDDQMQTAQTSMQEALGDDATVHVTGISTGDAESDPMGTMASMTKISGMLASGEIDVLLCDPDNARRYGDNGETYIALSDLFTDKELSALNAKATGVETVGDDGEATGEYSKDCGLDFSENETVQSILGRNDLQAFVIASTDKKHAAKALLQYLAK